MLVQQRELKKNKQKKQSGGVKDTNFPSGIEKQVHKLSSPIKMETVPEQFTNTVMENRGNFLW